MPAVWTLVASLKFSARAVEYPVHSRGRGCGIGTFTAMRWLHCRDQGQVVLFPFYPALHSCAWPAGELCHGPRSCSFLPWPCLPGFGSREWGGEWHLQLRH